MSGGRVTRAGAQLVLNGHPYRFCGMNVYRAANNSWNQMQNTSYQVNAGTTLADTLAAVNTPSMNCNVIRCWFFQSLALNSAGNSTPSLPYRWDALDKVLATADAANMKVIACLFDNWNWERANTGTSIDAAWYAGGYSTVTEPYDAVPYRQWVSDVTARYAGDDRILMWELVNEPDVSGGGTCPANAGSIFSAFCSDVGGVIKANDPGALVSAGSAAQVCGQNGADYSTVNSLSVIDLCSHHDYSGITSAFSPYGWQGACFSGGNGLDSSVSLAAALGKPVYVGECGIKYNDAVTLGNRATRANYLRAKMDLAFSTYKVCGYVPWQFKLNGYAGDDGYQYSVTDPALAVLGAYLNG